MPGTIYLAEFTAIPFSDNGAIENIAMAPPIAKQKVSISTLSTASSAFTDKTTFVRLSVDAGTPCSVAFGASPVATTNNMRMATN